ncbi:MAG: gamma-glutamyl-gamma-aminobutyrate hydrolase family protein [Clostridium sp.]
MNKRPVIGISGSMIIDEGGMFPGYKRSYVNNDYVKAVIEAGGIPFIIPMNLDDEVIKSQLEMVDGLILSGGHDVNPLEFNEEPHQKLGGIYPERDQFDFTLLRNAMDKKLPVFGICRGHQVINVVNGGSLYQDLSLIDGCYIKHNQGELSNVQTHTVYIEKDSVLNEVLGDVTTCNSFHHLAVNKVAPGFKVVARAKDGVVEAIERIEKPLVMGIQWHPEMLAGVDENMLSIFKYFVNECK